MCKKIICAVLTLVLVMSLVPAAAIPASAASCWDSNMTWHYEAGTLSISGSGNMDNFANVNSVPWYKYMNQIRTVSFLGGPFILGENSFPDGSYPKLENVVVDSLANWSISVFKGQNPLTLGTRPNLYLRDKKGNDQMIKDLVIPNGTGYINAGAFSGGSFTSVKIPGSVKTLDPGAFQNCRNLLSADIAEGLETIYHGAFAGTNLSTITLPNSLTTMQDSVFANCENLQSAYFGKGLKTMGNLTFYGCKNLTDVKLPAKLEYLGGGTFSGCTSLAHVDLPNTLTNLPSRTFENCSSMTRLDLPGSVRYVAGDACVGSALDSIHVVDMAAWCQIDFQGGNPLQSCHKLYHDDMLVKDLDIPESVTEINPYAFAGAHHLKSVTIPQYLTRIGANAFLDCPGITDVYVARKEQWDDLKAKKLAGNNDLFKVSGDHVHYVYPPTTPSTPEDVSGPEMKVSEQLVDMVAGMIPFRDTAYEVSEGRYQIGYGTPANKGDKITETEAKNVLRRYLGMAAYKVNSQYPSLSKERREAMAAFTMLNGSYWMGSGELHKMMSVASPKSSNFLMAIADLTYYEHKIDAVLAIANLYLNGKYESVAPSNYAYVTLDANGGNSSGSGRIQAYDKNESTLIDAKYNPSALGYDFVGWYTDPENGSLVTTLDSSTNAKILYAHYQLHNAGTEGDEVVGVPVSYMVPAYLSDRRDASNRVLVYANPKNNTVTNTLDSNTIVEITHEYRNPLDGKLWLRMKDSGWLDLGKKTAKPVEPGTVVLKPAQRLNVFEKKDFHSKIIGSLRNGDPVTVIERQIVGDVTWGKTVFLNENNMQFQVGWVDLAHVDFTGTINGGGGEAQTPDTPATPDTPTGKPAIATGTIVNCDRLNVRAEPNVYGKFHCKLSRGSKVNIYDKSTTHGVEWALLDQGWACMQYIQEDAAAPKPEEEQKPVNPGEVGTDDNKVALAKGQVIGNVRLNVRSGPGPQHKLVGSLDNGARFSIFQTKMYNGVQWGRMENGWVCMSYVHLDGDVIIKGEDPKPDQKPDAPKTLGQGRVVNCSTHVNVRASATPSSALQGTFSLGTVIDLLEETQHNGFTWYRTTKGWVCGDYVQKIAAPSNPTTPTNPVNPSNPVAPGTPSTVLTGTVSANVDVNVREAPGVQNRLVTTLRSGSKVNIYASQVVNGVTWYKIDQGWMAGDYIILNNGTAPNGGANGGLDGSAGTTETAKGQYATGTTAQAGLKVYAGAGYGYKEVKTLSLGTAVTIYEQRLLDGVAWGRIGNSEWVNLAFVTLKSTGITGTGTMGTIIRAGHAVNVRSTPSVDGARMATLLVGSPVEILEVKDLGNGESWGRTPQGWVNMYYVNMAGEVPTPPIVNPAPNPAPNPTPNPAPNPGTPTTPVKPADRGIPFNISGKMKNDSVLRMVPGILGDHDAKIEKGKTVQISKLETVDGMLWGLIDGGWLDMEHVQVNDFAIAETAQLVFENASNVKAVGALNKGEMVTLIKLEMDSAKKVWGQIDVNKWIEMTSITRAEQYSKTFMVKATIIADTMLLSGAGDETTKIEGIAAGSPVNVIGLQKDIKGIVWANLGNGWVPYDEISVNCPAKVTASTLILWQNPDMTKAADIKNQGDQVIIDQLALNSYGTPMGRTQSGKWIELSGISAI